MLALYINEYSIKKQRKGEILYIDGKQIINPKDEDYIMAGYKELVDTERPEYDIETQYLEITYINEENDILIHYEVKEIQPELESEQELE